MIDAQDSEKKNGDEGKRDGQENKVRVWTQCVPGRFEGNHLHGSRDDGEN